MKVTRMLLEAHKVKRLEAKINRTQKKLIKERKRLDTIRGALDELIVKHSASLGELRATISNSYSIDPDALCIDIKGREGQMPVKGIQRHTGPSGYEV